MREKLIKSLWYITGGRSMKYSEEFFFDYICWNPMDMYEDRLGRRFMARSPWSIRRIPLK